MVTTKHFLCPDSTGGAHSIGQSPWDERKKTPLAVPTKDKGLTLESCKSVLKAVVSYKQE